MMAGFLFGEELLEQQARFFGHGSPSAVLTSSSWLESVRMTATAHFYTSEGFSIAIDGRQRWTDVPSYDAHIRSLESDQVQKLFEILNEQMTLCYSVKGDIASEDRAFDLTAVLQEQFSKLRGSRFSTCRGYAEALAKATERVIRDAKGSGTLECFPASEVTLVGYFKGQPVWLDIQFKRGGFPNGRLSQVCKRRVKPGFCIVSGSDTVRSLVTMEHPLVADFNFPVNEKTSLKTADKITTGYVRACCSNWILQYDPTCVSCGGHVHTAIIRPPETKLARIVRTLKRGAPPRTGFQWVIAPLMTRESSI
jgi:hypothetical protein